MILNQQKKKVQIDELKDEEGIDCIEDCIEEVAISNIPIAVVKQHINGQISMNSKVLL